MYTLLIWEEVPETTSLYLIPSEEAVKYEKFLTLAHMKLYNCDEVNDGMRFVNTALGSEFPEPGFEEYLGIFRNYKWDQDKPIVNKTINAVYVTGFHM